MKWPYIFMLPNIANSPSGVRVLDYIGTLRRNIARFRSVAGKFIEFDVASFGGSRRWLKRKAQFVGDQVNRGSTIGFNAEGCLLQFAGPADENIVGEFSPTVGAD